MMTRNCAPGPIEIQIDDLAWRGLGSALASAIRRAIRLALASAEAQQACTGLTVLLTADSRVRALNRDYLGKDKPTNVLSFPSQAPEYLGDIAIAYGVTAHEAETASLPLLDHVLHLTVHGVLHLLGYDHDSAAGAEMMESLEAEILAQMGIPDPYSRRGRAA